MRQTRLIQAAALVLGLVLLLTGCVSQPPAAGETKNPPASSGKPNAPASPGKASDSNPAGDQNNTGEDQENNAPSITLPELAGDMPGLQGALMEPSPLTYKIAVAEAPKGADKTAYLDQMLAAQKGYPGKNEILLLIFPQDNNDIRFAMGAFLFEKKVSVESMLQMVRSHYFPKARVGDPAGGLADLVRAVNQAVK